MNKEIAAHDDEVAMVEEFPVVVVGGGPAGSTLATVVAMRGHRVVLLEKESHPRYQIGESLLPSTVHGICRLLGVSAELAAAGFPVKRGGTFKWGTNPEPWTFSFAVSQKMAGPTSYAYQVERMKFDQILLDNARRKGVEVRENCSVLDVIGDGERVEGVRYTDPEGRERRVAATFVVDASGNRSRIHHGAQGTRRYSEFFRNLALFGYFEGGRRLAPPYSGNILSVAFDSGWFWYIPLSDRLTSVGAVVRREMADKVQGDPEQALLGLIAECPLISDYLSAAHRVTEGVYGQIRARKDYSYCNTKFWRPGMVLVGDAACFVDPVFSSGVHLATYSGLLAARSINSVLAGDLDEKVAMGEFESRYRREYGVFYEFLTSFYDMHVDEQSYFWEARKVTRCPETDLEAFVELVGGVSADESALVGAKSVSNRLQTVSDELGTAIDGVAEDPGKGMRRLFNTPAIRNALAEGAKIQARAWLGKDAGEEAPVFAGGLVPSDDGTSWVVSPGQV